MTHLTDSILEALRQGKRVARRDHAHVDRCLTCRKSLGAPLAPVTPRSRKPLLLASVALAVIVAAFISIAPLRGAAYGFIEIFEPRQVAFIPMTVNDFKEMSALPDFEDFGVSSQIVASQERDTPDLRAAQALAGYRLRMPGGDATGAQFNVTTPALEQFVFSDAKARESATRKGVAWQPMPYGMDGSVVRVAFGSMVLARFDNGWYESAPAPPPAPASRTAPLQRPRVVRVTGVVLTSAGERRTPRYIYRPQPPRGGRFDGSLFVAQMPVPKVGSTGVSMAQIERYIVDRPGVSPRLAAAFASLRDPSSTLPIPIPIDKQYAHPVIVDGVQGTLIGDETGLGSAVFWERDGFAYAVAGSHSDSEIIAIANSLR